jgi:riboflavin kinase/FMN adenylyltransferase
VALTSGQIRIAKEYLGRPYSISGRVVHGDATGRKLGYPTANIQMKHNLPPLKGGYVVLAHAEALGVLQGVASLGIRPTLKHDAKAVLEVHLFEFDQQIYGRHLRVEFLQKLRDEQKFNGLEGLTRQIALDVENAKQWFKQQIDYPKH